MTPPPATGRALLRSCAPALLRSCAPALLRSCDYTSCRPSPPCQGYRVTFLFGISPFIHAKAIASGSLPHHRGMLTSQPSQPGHSLAHAPVIR